MNELIDKVENLPNLLDTIKNECSQKEIPIILFGKDDISNLTYNLLLNNNIIINEQCDENDFVSKINKFDLVNVIITNRNPNKSKEFLGQFNNIKNIFFYDALGEKYYRLNYKDFLDKIKDYEKVYNLLEDEISKKVFVAFLNTKISSDYTYTQSTETWGQYVEEGVVDFSNIDSIVDCGSYHGEDIIKFSKVYSKLNRSYKNIIAFEANNKNFLYIKKMMKENNICNIELHNLATWNKKEELMFESETQESWSHISKEGKNIVKADTIDNILNGRRCDYIKMDIEGAEYNSLLGAKNTILKDNTQLAISIYHRPNDIIDIPLLIKQYNSSYKFYLRNHCKFGMDCVFYAIRK